MTVSKEQFEELSAKVNTLSESFSTIGNTISEAVASAVKPLTDNLADMQANQKAKDDAEKAGLVEKVVKANLLTETVANELTLNALKELASKAEPAHAAALNSAYKPDNGKPAYQLPEGN